MSGNSAVPNWLPVSFEIIAVVIANIFYLELEITVFCPYITNRMNLDQREHFSLDLMRPSAIALHTARVIIINKILARKW